MKVSLSSVSLKCSSTFALGVIWMFSGIFWIHLGCLMNDDDWIGSLKILYIWSVLFAVHRAEMLKFGH